MMNIFSKLNCEYSSKIIKNSVLSGHLIGRWHFGWLELKLVFGGKKFLVSLSSAESSEYEKTKK